jgi:hypothetical protein
MGLKDLEKILIIPIIDWVEKIESLVCKRCKRVISLMVGENKSTRLIVDWFEKN